MGNIDKETVIRTLVRSALKSFASGFSDRRSSKVGNKSISNMEKQDVFITTLGADIQFYTNLTYPLEGSLEKTFQSIAIEIAKLRNDISQMIDGATDLEQADFFAKLFEGYKKVKGDDVRGFWNCPCTSL